MRIPASSLTKRNSPMLMAAVACDAARRTCETCGRKELGAWIRGCKVAAGKATFLTGRSMANAELALLSSEISAELARVMGPFFPGVKIWKALFA